MQGLSSSILATPHAIYGDVKKIFPKADGKVIVENRRIRFDVRFNLGSLSIETAVDSEAFLANLTEMFKKIQMAKTLPQDPIPYQLDHSRFRWESRLKIGKDLDGLSMKEKMENVSMYF